MNKSVCVVLMTFGVLVALLIKSGEGQELINGLAFGDTGTTQSSLTSVDSLITPTTSVSLDNSTSSTFPSSTFQNTSDSFNASWSTIPVDSSTSSTLVSAARPKTNMAEHCGYRKGELRLVMLVILSYINHQL